MSEPANGFEFLEILRRKNGKEKQGYNDFFRYLEFKARQKNVPVCGCFELTSGDSDRESAQGPLPVDTWKRLMHQAWEAGMIRASFSEKECLAYAGFDELVHYLHGIGCEVLVAADGNDCTAGGEGVSSFVMDCTGTLMPGRQLDWIRADALREGFKAAWEKVSGEVRSRTAVSGLGSAASAI